MKDINSTNISETKKSDRFNWGKLFAVLCCVLLFTVVACKPKDEDKSKNIAKTETKKTEKKQPEKKDEPKKERQDTDIKITKKPHFIEEDLVSGMSRSELEKFKNSLNFEKVNPKATAHEKYLSDKFELKEVPNPKFDTKKSAVVGSRVCKFYPNAQLKTQEDLKNLPEGIEVPFATLLPIYGEAIKAPEHKAEKYYYEIDFFHFEDNYNWFYHTKWNGQEGLVFGADLTGINFPTDKNRIISLQYASKGVSKEFYPTHRYNYLSDEIKNSLSKNKLAFQEVSYSEYGLGKGTPDDMIALYANHYNGVAYENEPIFITTDLMAHARHLVFDRTIQHTEEFFFFPRLWDLTQAFLKELKTVNTDGKVTANPETLEKTKLYFQVAQALCELAPTLTEEKDEYGEISKVYKEEDAEKILANYDRLIKAEIKLINEAKENTQSALFTFADGSFTKEDYTQYKPRGHYTKNKLLEAYFKTMMWYGRAHFLIAKSGEKTLAQNGSAASDSEELTYNMEPIALLITELVKNNPELYQKWTELFDPITDLIGLSDDLSFKEIMPLWKSYDVKDFKEWSSNKENLIKLMKEAHEKLRPPAIAGSSVFYTASEGKERKPPMGWRLFGQRYTFDSAIHHQVSSPRLYGRAMVKGLDIIKAFGSKTADKYLVEDYKEFPELKNKLSSIEKEISNNPEKVFSKTYYGTVLNEIALQAKFEKGAGFYFTESDAWNKKALLSAHGTWAELRHDTILYVKQACSEFGGGGDEAPTFRTEPIPLPVHYIEPNLAFWKNAKVSTELFLNTLKTYKLTTKLIESQIEQLIKINKNAIRIVKLEFEDKEVKKEDLNFIARLPYSLASVVLIGRDSFMDQFTPEDLQMAIVADIFTDSENGLALEIASGIPYRVYIPLNDKQGGKRIAVGYCFNYYEFTQPSAERLNDEEWKKKVYIEEGVPEDFKPSWARNIAIPAEPKKEE